MPPQQSDPSVPPPSITPSPSGNLDPNYGFIFNGQKPKKGFSLHLPSGSNKMVKITAVVTGVGIVLIIAIIVLSTLLGPKGVNTKQLVDVMAQATEISRVSGIITSQQQKSIDANTLNLATTTSNALTSEQVQLSNYLHKARVKVSPKDLNHYLDKTTDTQLQTAGQNNNLDATYNAYLKQHISTYKNAIKTVYQSSSPTAKTILSNADLSAAAILSAPQLATTSGL